MLFFRSGPEGTNSAGGFGVHAQRRFKSVPELRQLLEKNCQETFEPGDFLLIYDTANQHTWLATSGQSLCCIIDLRSEPDPKLIWQIPMGRFFENGDMTIRISAEEVGADTGYVQIEDQRVRKFSTSLFTAAELEDRIKQMLVKGRPRTAS